MQDMLWQQIDLRSSSERSGSSWIVHCENNTSSAHAAVTQLHMVCVHVLMCLCWKIIRVTYHLITSTSHITKNELLKLRYCLLNVPLKNLRSPF